MTADGRIARPFDTAFRQRRNSAVVRRGFWRLTAAAAVGCLIVLLVTSAEATVGRPPGTPAVRPWPPQATGTPGLAQGNGRRAAAIHDAVILP